MKVLVIGSGGREHALAWKISQSSRVEKVYVAPGNAGTELEPGVENIAINSDDLEALVAFAKETRVELTIVGPEAPLVNGISDIFRAEALPCFGPSRKASLLEGSKAFAKDFMARRRIPSSAYQIFTEVEPAVTYIRKTGTPLVVKADGLAAGKGVIIAENETEAVEAVKGMLSGRDFGDAGRKVIIEECLYGEEASFIVMTDGTHILPLATSQDHKAAHDGDRGPNTGGMGAYSPAPVVSGQLNDKIMNEIIQPTVRGMAEEGNPYMGFLYAGIMVTEDGRLMVLEYNCRFGDPETQPILMRLKSELSELCLAALEKRLDKTEALWDERASLGVVMAAGGYPGEYAKGDEISGLPERESKNTKVFHAGTSLRDGRLVTSGGRVLCATALGDTIRDAREQAYSLAQKITWNNVYYRADIGHRAISRGH